MNNKRSPFQLIIDPAAALAAAARLRSHLPPYTGMLPLAAEENDENEMGIAPRSEKAGAGQS